MNDFCLYILGAHDVEFCGDVPLLREIFHEMRQRDTFHIGKIGSIIIIHIHITFFSFLRKSPQF